MPSIKGIGRVKNKQNSVLRHKATSSDKFMLITSNFFLLSVEKRGWAMSTLFVDKSDVFPTNLTSATMSVLHVNMMPAYGLNVHSMIKHKNLVLTKAAVEHIEERLLFAQRRVDQSEKRDSTKIDSTVEMPSHNSFGSLS